MLWKQHAQKVVWTFVRDQAPIGGYDVTYQSGVYLHDGTPKLSQQAIAFPVACERTRRGKLRVWGKAPAPGRVDLLRGGKKVAHLTARNEPRVPQDRPRPGRGPSQGWRCDEPALHSCA